jgi:Spy/CpxP family protein refolding chaperone
VQRSVCAAGLPDQEILIMKKGLILSTVTVLVVLTASPAMAERDWRGGYGSGPGSVTDIAGTPGLNLSPEQREQIGVLREAHRRDHRPLEEQLMAKGRQLRELWLAKTPDRERIMALHREVHDLRGRLLEKLAIYRLEVLQMLTPDQRAKVQTFEAERHRGRMGAPGIGPGPFPGLRDGGPPPAGNPPLREARPGRPPKEGDEGAHGVR